ncbi:U6 snRNA-associated Sm-like protein LSm7 [Gregarina niphandrodes]|uniref:U6 snRNA-associated Sm-like protein LSm7 n=1 Tax=Gregarina niphandrodes TaxID=110365 RepID=A0A023BAH1_GRENI|nr:U6 snRNA-associated Sm-like protein LSm7 [Gregarina niphandrodes]EZG78291.1 U6 snRNA-associated Sm-like protein LSm7 [Gregarina niphandrodes]|eukprot:XP_011129360.1 U6 snRNA-associated Sm-like protein LSm7 [Gregarina niphandrodes]
MNSAPKKSDLERFLNQKVFMRFQGGREVSGRLKGFDENTNVVLDESVEYVRNTKNEPTQRKRHLGLLVVRGITVESMSAEEDMIEIENPYN